jgi:hypothetical protein
MRIGILMMYDSSYESMARITIDQNARQYCDLNGYRLFEHRIEGSENDRPAQWQKVIKSIEILESGEVDWLFFLDLDCLVMNSSIRLEDIIDDDFSLIIPSHGVPAIDFPLEDNGFGGDNIISAMFLVKADEKGIAILKDVWSCSGSPEVFPRDHFYYEQRQFRLTIPKPEFRSHIKIVEERTMSTFWPVNNPFVVLHFKGCNENMWKSGDFIVHVTGYEYGERVKLLSDINYFSGGAITKSRLEEDRILFSPLDNIDVANIAIKDIEGSVLATSRFEGMSCRINYFMTLPGNFHRVVLEAKDDSGRLIAKRIVER